MAVEFDGSLFCRVSLFCRGWKEMWVMYSLETSVANLWSVCWLGAAACVCLCARRHLLSISC